MEKLSTNLQSLLADTYILMLKTHNFHWNVSGPHFAALHSMFEVQYNELFIAADEIAERIRSLGKYAPGSYSEFNALSEIKDSTQKHYKEMIEELALSNKMVIKTANALIKDAQRLHDDATADLAIRRITTHEKYVWMLESLLKEG